MEALTELLLLVLACAWMLLVLVLAFIAASMRAKAKQWRSKDR